jgi:F-type H+-transporting ATPase subunit gamma
MPSAREMRLRIKSVKNISQLTRALQTVSASYVRKSIRALTATRPYAEKSWKVLVHLARQPGHTALHPLLTERKEVQRILVVMISSDRGLAGAFNMNVVRHTLDHFDALPQPISYITVGRKGRDMLLRRHKNVIAEFSSLPTPPSFADISAIGRLAVEEFLNGDADQVFLAYTDFVNMVTQKPVIRKLLPLHVVYGESESEPYNVSHHPSNAVFIYEPSADELLNQIVPRFTGLQVYESILESQTSEHAARMVSMRNATENALDLMGGLQLEYNKARQQTITNEMLDIAGGAEALAQAMSNQE